MMIFSEACLTLVKLIIFYLFMAAHSASIFMAYDEPNFGGFPIYCEDKGNGCNVSEVISIKLAAGTCGQILNPKTGQLFFIKKNIANADYYYDGQLSTCPSHMSRVECPNGTFVKEIEWDIGLKLTEGVKLSCNKPDSSSETIAIYSHQTKIFSNSKTVKCASFQELTVNKNMSMDSIVDLDIGADCVAVNKTNQDETLKCEPFTAISGINFSIETETNYIKQMSLICSDVPNIATLCKAEDDERQLSLPSIGEITKTVGVGLKPTMSESEKHDFQFYSKYKLEMEYALSNNFKDHIGKNGTTGYDWASAPKSTWQNEQKVTIEIETTSQCTTKLSEIVGSCSYMNIRPYHLKRVDNCAGRSFTNIERIPHNIRKRSYKSKIPDSVQSKIEVS